MVCDFSFSKISSSSAPDELVPQETPSGDTAEASQTLDRAVAGTDNTKAVAADTPPSISTRPTPQVVASRIAIERPAAKRTTSASSIIEVTNARVHSQTGAPLAGPPRVTCTTIMGQRQSLKTLRPTSPDHIIVPNAAKVDAAFCWNPPPAAVVSPRVVRNRSPVRPGPARGSDNTQRSPRFAPSRSPSCPQRLPHADVSAAGTRASSCSKTVVEVQAVRGQTMLGLGSEQNLSHSRPLLSSGSFTAPLNGSFKAPLTASLRGTA